MWKKSEKKKFFKKAKKDPKVQKSVKKAEFHSIGATIRSCRESWFLP